MAPACICHPVTEPCTCTFLDPKKCLFSRLFARNNFIHCRHAVSPGLGSNTFYQIQIQIQIHFFPEFQIQIQIHRQKSDQIQIQIQIQLIKYKYKYTMRPRQNCGHFTDEIIDTCILYCKNIVLFIHVSLKIISKCPIYNKPTLVQIMAWRWVGNKPLSDQWWPGLLMYKCHPSPVISDDK